jgi:hypothetical protein
MAECRGVAQSPFVRAGAHFGSNKTANAIRRHLAAPDNGSVEPEHCKSLSCFVYGPVLPYVHQKPRHADFEQSRKAIGKLERQLWAAAVDAGNKMLNGRPRFLADFDETVWKGVHAAFKRPLGLR